MAAHTNSSDSPVTLQTIKNLRKMVITRVKTANLRFIVKNDNSIHGSVADLMDGRELCGRGQKSKKWRALSTAFAALSVLGILAFTLFDRTSDGGRTMSFIRTLADIRARPELKREMLMNADISLY